MTPLKQAFFTDATDSGGSRSDTDTALRGWRNTCTESPVFPSISLVVSFTVTKRDSERRHGGIALWRPKANDKIRYAVIIRNSRFAIRNCLSINASAAK